MSCGCTSLVAGACVWQGPAQQVCGPVPAASLHLVQGGQREQPGPSVNTAHAGLPGLQLPPVPVALFAADQIIQHLLP